MEAEHNPGASGGVLLVDDDPDDLSLLQDLIANRLPGVPVQVATSPEQALDVLRDEKPSVIVSDYWMPGMDGVEFLRRARALAPQARFIMLTGAPDRFAFESGQAESYSVLAKPIQPDLLAKLLQTLVRRSSDR